MASVSLNLLQFCVSCAWVYTAVALFLQLFQQPLFGVEPLLQTAEPDSQHGQELDATPGESI